MKFTERAPTYGAQKLLLASEDGKVCLVVYGYMLGQLRIQVEQYQHDDNVVKFEAGECGPPHILLEL